MTEDDRDQRGDLMDRPYSVGEILAAIVRLYRRYPLPNRSALAATPYGECLPNA